MERETNLPIYDLVENRLKI